LNFIPIYAIGKEIFNLFPTQALEIFISYGSLKMSNIQVLTVRIPLELKERLEQQAKFQGTSLNQLSNYLLTTQLTQLETLSFLEKKLARKQIHDLKKKVKSILTKIPDREVSTLQRRIHFGGLINQTPTG
jgi:predicted DNA-binding protein